MKRQNERKLSKVFTVLNDRALDDYDGPVTVVTDTETQSILEVIGDEVGVPVSVPATEAQALTVYEEIRDPYLWELWDLLDTGWHELERYRVLPRVYLQMKDRGSFLKKEWEEVVEWQV